MTPTIAKTIFVAGVAIFVIIRYPHERRARGLLRHAGANRPGEVALVTVAALGLGIIPFVYIGTGFPRGADRPFVSGLAWLGAVLFAVGLFVLRRAHKALGRNFCSIPVIAENHVLVLTGPYAYVRHPIYSSLFLWASAQALLLPNWVAGFSGLLGFGIEYFLRIDREEQMLIDRFGDAYRDYMNRTARIVPGLF